MQTSVIGLDCSGQKADVDLVCRELNALGHQAKPVYRQPLTLGMRVVARLGAQRLFSCTTGLNVFIQQPEHYWIPLAKRNVVIPNQDWMTPYGASLLSRMDAIWCKTRYATDIFSRRGLTCRYIGFSSPVAGSDPEPLGRDWYSCLHVAGSSLAKGTQGLVDLWAQHPEWPQLTVLARHPSLRPPTQVANIVWLKDHVHREELRILRMRCGIAIQPSETEGFGHVISEALAACQVVLTCDAPPMNELLSPLEGFLVKASAYSNQHLSELFRFDRAEMERTLNHIFATPRATLAGLGRAASTRFARGQQQFRSNLEAAILALPI